MKKFVSGTIVGIITVAGLYWIFTLKSYDEEFYFPEGYQGCAYVVYNIRGAPQLEIEGNAIHYYFGKDGLLFTTSPPDFGWEGRDTSGFHDVRYFYADEKGEKTKEIPESDIGFVALGEYSENGIVRVNSLSIPVGDSAKACDDNYEELYKKIEKKLNPVE